MENLGKGLSATLGPEQPAEEWMRKIVDCREIFVSLTTNRAS